MDARKRRGPTARPVEHQRIRYEQLHCARDQGFAQAGGVIAATEIASGLRLWVAQPYQTLFDPAEERDTQEVYVVELRLENELLRALDERHRVWWLRLHDGQRVDTMGGRTAPGRSEDELPAPTAIPRPPD